MVGPEILLPLRISFFTFQQIAFLVDVRRQTTTETSLLRYALFVSFFPQLVAGPIVRHQILGPQLVKLGRRGITSKNLALGISIFTIGLFKKVVIADNLGEFVAPVLTVMPNQPWYLPGAQSLPTRFRFISTFPATRIWRSDLPESSVSYCR